ncbi:DUF1801 domain-containing protein [Spirochaeta isovalerica]|uniref:Uncharacterized protein YdhG (YjbR/CyaY superfamily) n=1 Tax=Spirochaeta isovalerica TaxID=150 RepID=A0A841RBL5_9SPIO|nr:DUF1801 domain-containing protein [Spirochaeta isovalerica]MBB6480299.1 uncharacterized protein YdhG (YjbR/CyaY superfamily) [Spirochaeta isovalerica]
MIDMKMPAPAHRALESLKIEDFSDFTNFTIDEIASLHGLGPSVMKKIEEKLLEMGTYFKVEPSPEVDAYMETFTGERRAKLKQLREIIRKSAPLATEKMTYGMPTYHQGENLVHFAGNKNHIGFYPTPAGIEEFSPELKAYKASKGAVQLPWDEELPLDLLERIVLYRVAATR